MSKRRSIAVAGALAALLGASQFGLAGPALAEIKIGFITSMTGAASSIGIPYSKGMATGAAAIGSVGGEKLTYIQIDDGFDPSAAARAARKLIEEDKVDILCGSAGAPPSLAAAAVAAEQKVPFVVIANVIVPGEGANWSITVPQSPVLMVAADVEHMKKAGIKTVAYIGFSDAWGDLVYNSLKKTAEPAGIEVLTNERYARADTSVTAQILKILATHPDAVLTGGSGTPGALPHIALADRGYTGPEYSTHAIINSEFVRVGGAAVEGVIAPTGPMVVADQLSDSNPIKKVALDFLSLYKKVNNEPSTDAFAAYGYDGWLIIADSAKRALATGAKPGTPEFRVAMRDAMTTTRELVGTHGIYTFHLGQAFGTDERSRVMVKLDKGGWKLLP
ncbi:amino acid/amide ABC transporter substrate-binding protein, HAAT family [Rhizobiales bacterium GAS113]|nr:amino acid/amide ABC transporter substrate-binding protein, HAAT family [Rhizobiales bacterium GAS113]